MANLFYRSTGHVANEKKWKAIIMQYAVSDLARSWTWELMLVHSLLRELSSPSTSRVITALKVQLLNVTHNFNSNIFSFLGELYMLWLQFPSGTGIDVCRLLNGTYLQACAKSRAPNIWDCLCLKYMFGGISEFFNRIAKSQE